MSFIEKFFYHVSYLVSFVSATLYQRVPGFVTHVCNFPIVPLSLIVYYQLEETLSPLGKTIYQSKVKGQIQLGGDKVNEYFAVVCRHL